MKAVIVKAHEEKGWTVGTKVDVTPEQFNLLVADEYAVSASEWEAKQDAIKATERANKAAECAIDNAIKTAVARGAFLPKEDTSVVKATAVRMEQFEAGMGVAHIGNLPVKASDKSNELSQRMTSSTESSGAEVDEDKNVIQLVKGFVHANEPFAKEIRNGGIVRAARQDESKIKAACELSMARSTVARKLGDLIAAGANFAMKDVVKATTMTGADLNTADGTIGTLNTGLVLQWNLGYLKNQLAIIDDITTDISNQPAHYQQNILTRYVKVPGVQLKTSSNAWTGGSGQGTVDVNMQMDTHAGVPLTFNENVLGATARQLFNEQRQPQLYGLGEYIIYKLIYCAMNGSKRFANDALTYSTVAFNPGYTNTLGTHVFNVAGATLSTFVADLPEAMDESKFPGGDEPPGETNLQRFVWVHGRVYSAAAADTNFLLNSSIQGIRGQTGDNVMATGRFERIGNTKFRKSQLVTDQCATTGTGADGTSNVLLVTAGTFASATKVGIAGTRSALIFASRVPVDYTKVMPEIPSTAAIELVTEPDTGITFQVVKFLDHACETASMRVQLMFGVGIGDERQGMYLVQK